jgi:hypothetical protein
VGLTVGVLFSAVLLSVSSWNGVTHFSMSGLRRVGYVSENPVRVSLFVSVS